MKIKKGDQVKIIAGKDRGKTGAVIKIFEETGRVSVEGINLYKKRMRPKKQGQKGETVQVPRPLSISNVMVSCTNCKQPSRMGHRMEGEKKFRYCKRCGVSQ
ncbi:MAG: 50S ribosomal protein L24 [Candidatus Liptonbacteria bacterium RIFCSPLOWO2_01_FULL_53_13]|uniref:Large ribosomal subunit protein uL24 n=1 Tax=Candidatus Liptonbacteria bacterium RIFCSPLOWO2_01_FULL_53_13 TaxID=1798651 RepID=A0A1G2CKX5_9BACT|nr:MAG: 50S ribosomal protein L24 [Candidatus Liptonbacteria bacterium RIFCSPLOWO2_01_FULL_53_13]